MATWIGHLRIAEKLYAAIPGLDETAFAFGNLAPDSGKPNADWSEFDPPKEITHFLREGGGEDKIHDLEFYRDYLLPEMAAEDRTRYSYLLGYFFHLLSDNLWARRVYRSSKRRFADEFAAQGGGFVWTLKKDWYDLDFRYVRDHAGSLFWRVIVPTPNPPPYLHFLSNEGLNQSFDHIRYMYSHPDPASLLDRPYPYLNETTMSRFVTDASASVLKIHEVLQGRPEFNGQVSALALLPPEDVVPYDPPLGDE